MPGPFLHPFSRPAAEEHLCIVRGEGAAVFDDQGNRYVDALASLWYCQVGHGRRRIAEAVGSQLARLDNFNTFDIYTNEPAEAVARRIAQLAPVEDARVFLTSSGSEAVDTAIKLARITHVRRGDPGRTMIVSRQNAYHGVTYGGMSVQGLPLNKEGFGPLLAGVHHVAHDELEEVEAVFAEHGDRIAAMIAEPVIGAGGVYPPQEGYLKGLRRLCDEHGALLIIDEVITGFGRLGAWFASGPWDLSPDLLVFAKGVTSGYLPLGGVVVGGVVREALEHDPQWVLRHGFTNSGHPAACVAGSVNIEIIAEESLCERAHPIGEHLRAGFGSIEADGLLSEVRGTAGIWAVVMPAGVSAPAVRDAMLRRGVLARPIGEDTIAFCPPLVIDGEDLDLCIEALRGAVEQVVAEASTRP